MNQATNQQSAETRWKLAVAAARERGLDQVSAIKSVERTHPGLRLQMLEEVNANRPNRRR